MKHEDPDLHELLCAYVLGEANDEERARIEAALEESEALREQRARLEATIGLVQDVMAEPVELSPAARGELLDRAGMRPRTPLRARPGLRLAAAVLLLVGGGLLWIGSRDGGKMDLKPSSELAYRSPLEKERAGVERERKNLADGLSAKREGAGKDAGARASELSGSKEQLGLGTAAGLDSSAEAPVDARFEAPRDEVAEVEKRRYETGAPAEMRADRDGTGPVVSLPEVEAPEPFMEELEDLGYAGAEAYDESIVAEPNPAPEPPALAPLVQAAGRDLETAGAPTTGVSIQVSGSGGAIRPDSATTGSDDFFLGQGARSTTTSGGISTARTQEPSRAPRSSGSSGPAGPRAARAKTEVAFEGGRYGLRRVPEATSAHGSAGPAAPQAESDPAAASKGPITGAPTTGGPGLYAGRQSVLEDPRVFADRLIRGCRRRPGETPSMMFFRYWGDNPFEYPLGDPLSTFSVDVDTASYALARKYLLSGNIPPKEAVRTEEFVNYFDADVPPPLEGDFAIHTDLAPSLFGGAPDRWMMRVVVRGREVAKEERAPLSLTFVVDTSGSMQQENRMELVKHALRLLVAELDANDSIALVAFSSEARLVLPTTSVASRSLIETAINGLAATGSTNAEAGLKLGYAQASAALREGAGNRVVLLSDGVANVGQTDQDRLVEDVRAQRERGIYLNTIGVGLGNHNDVFLEQLANRGDGLCNYVDDEREAYRAIVENFTGAFEAIARDVKVQVEFDPSQVESYRLLGYENRAIADEDFRNDAVDAGEVGAGHQVTALYELVRCSTRSEVERPLATVRLRWKKPFEVRLDPAEREGDDAATEIEHPVDARTASGSFAATSPGYRRAVLVAQFAEFLRRSRHARGDSLDTLIAEAKRLEGQLADPDFSEFVALLDRSRGLILSTLSPADELARTVDALREHQILVARYQSLLEADAARRSAEELEMLERLERQNRELEEKIRELLRRRLEKESPPEEPDGADRR